MKAIWNNQIIAESEDTIVVKGNRYFPESSLNKMFLEDSETNTNCPWKGIASYYTLNINNQKNEDAAWFYPEPKPAASKIKGRVAFWNGVEIKN